MSANIVLCNFSTEVSTFHYFFTISIKLSSEAKVADTVLQGIYHFKIHDVFYHRSGSLTAGYGREPCYAQLYFYDVDTAVNYRLRQQNNSNCKQNLMRSII